jgi:hypothetical protein
MIVVYEDIIDYILKLQEKAALAGRDIKYLVITEDELGEIRAAISPQPTLRTAADEVGVYGRIFGLPLVNSQYHVRQLRKGQYE